MKSSSVLDYFGGKLRMTQAGLYPPPEDLPIVECFAGGAGYSLAWQCPRVVLIERDPKVAAVWKYLARVSALELLALPDLSQDQTVDELPVCQEARWLIGFNVNASVTSPMKRMSKWARQAPSSYWGTAARRRIAEQLKFIRQWQVHEGSYEDAEQLVTKRATWFVDPPYHASGHNYKQHSKNPDWYKHLGEWCRRRRGLVIVCEQSPADWLPFAPIHEINRGGQRGPKKCLDVSWVARNP